KEDSTFVAQFMKKEIKAKGTKDLEITKIIYYSANNEWLEKTIEGTDIINYPEEFRESGLETREFLYWAARTTAYIDESVPRIKPEEDITKVDFSDYVFIHNGEYSIELYAIYKTDQVTLSFDYITKDNKLITSKEITKPFSYHYVTEENGSKIYKFTTGEVTMPEVKINDIKSVYTWIPEFLYGFPPIRSKAQNELYRTEYEPTKTYEFTNEIPDYIILETLMYGYIHLYGEYTGIKVIYEKGDLQGEPPVDNNIYGYAPGQKSYLTIADGGTLTSEDSVFYGWKTYNGDILKENDLITFQKLLNIVHSDEDNAKVNLTPVLIRAPEVTFDLSSLPSNIEIEKPELIVLNSKWSNKYAFLLPDISDEIKNSNYVFIGWKNKQLDEIYEPFAAQYTYENGVVLEPIVMEKSKFKIVYECPDSVTCPVDNTEYELGDDIKLKNMPVDGLEYNGSYFNGWYPLDYVWQDYDYRSFITIPVFKYINAITNGELRLDAIYTELDILCNPNEKDVLLEKNLINIEKLPLLYNYYLSIPVKENKYFIGWSLTPDNKNPDEFLSYWTATIDDVKELIKGKEKPVQLYAQWMSEEELKNRNDFIKVTFELNQGNGNKLAVTTYAPKGFKLDASKFLSQNKYSELYQKLTYEYSNIDTYCIFTEELYVKDLDGEYKKDIVLPMDVSEVTYEIKNREIPTSYMVSEHGVYYNKTGEIIKYIQDSGEDIYLRTLDLPIPVADEGYVFAGWKLSPVFSPYQPSYSRNNNQNNTEIKTNWYTLKKEIWSTEELSKTPIYEGNLVDSLLPPYARSFLISKLNVIAVFEPTGKVEYYYDGVKDDEATETLTDLHTGDTVTAYPDKSKDGMYEVDKTDGLPMIVDDDYTKNVIKVYYKKK
ncbi:hypothetical protein N4321_13750, partial [Longicatena caecimuris]|nr:hypothetical protein [Longicatena caecimuris]